MKNILIFPRQFFFLCLYHLPLSHAHISQHSNQGKCLERQNAIWKRKKKFGEKERETERKLCLCTTYLSLKMVKVLSPARKKSARHDQKIWLHFWKQDEQRRGKSKKLKDILRGFRCFSIFRRFPTGPHAPVHAKILICVWHYYYCYYHSFLLLRFRTVNFFKMHCTVNDGKDIVSLFPTSSTFAPTNILFPRWNVKWQKKKVFK